MPVLGIDIDPKGAQAGAAAVNQAFDSVTAKARTLSESASSSFQKMGESIQKVASQADAVNNLTKSIDQMMEAQKRAQQAARDDVSLLQQKIAIQKQVLQSTLSIAEGNQKMAESAIFARVKDRELAQQMAATQAEYRKNEQAIAALAAKQKEAQEQTSRFSQVLGTIQSAAGVAGIVLSLTVAVGLLKAGVEEGIRYNAQIEQQRIGIASIVAATTNVADAQGRTLEGAEKFNAAQQISADLMAKIQQDALRTTATTEQLVDAFQSAVGPLTAAGLSLDQSRDATVRIVQAATALGIPMNQVAQEVRAIAEGSIDVNARLAKTLNITNAQVEGLKAQGKLYEFIVEKTDAFAQAGSATEKSFFGLASSISDVSSQLLGLAAAPVFDAIKSGMQATLDLLLEVKRRIDEIRKPDDAGPSPVIAQINSELAAAQERLRNLRDLQQDGIFVSPAVIAAEENGIAQLNAQLSLLNGTTDQYVVSAQAAAKASEELARKQAQAAQSLGEENSVLQLKVQVLEQAKIKGESYAKAMEAVNTAVNVQKTGNVAAAEKNRELQATYDDLTKGMKGSEDTAKRLSKEKEKAAEAAAKLSKAEAEQIGILQQEVSINAQVLAGTLSAAQAEQQKDAARRAAKTTSQATADTEARLAAVIRDQNQAIQENNRRFQERQAQFQQMQQQQSNFLTSFEEEMSLLHKELGLRQQVTQGVITQQQATRELAVAQKEAQLRSQGAVDGMRGINDTVRGMAEELVNASDQLNRVGQGFLNLSDLAAGFNDVIVGVFRDGPDSLGNIVLRYGQGLGLKLIQGIAFGKGELEDRVLIPNFSNVFGENGIIGSIISGSGRTQGSNFISNLLSGITGSGDFLGSTLGFGGSGLFSSGLFKQGSIFGGLGSGGLFGQSLPPGVFGPPAPGFFSQGSGLFGGSGFGGFGAAAGIGSAIFGKGSDLSRGISGGLGAAALIPGPQQPFVAAAALIASLFSSDIFGLNKPGRIATEKKDINKLFKEFFPEDKFKVRQEPQVATGLSTFDDSSDAALALGALYASGQKNATAGTVKRFGGQFLGNLKEQGKSSEEAAAATLKLAQAMGADLPTAIAKANELVGKGTLSNEQFSKQMDDSRKNLAKYGDTTGLTAQQLTELALENGNVGSTVVTLNKLYAGAIDISTGFSESVNGAAIANDLLASKFADVAGGASALNGQVGDLEKQVRGGSISIEEAIQKLNGMRTAAGETALALNQFTLDPERIQKEIGLIQASVVEAQKAGESLGQMLGESIMGGLSNADFSQGIDAFFQNLFGQQVLGSILKSSLESLDIEKTLQPIFLKILRVQDDLASGAIDQAGFQAKIKDIVADAGPAIEKIKTGLLAAGESGHMLLEALGLIPEKVEEAGTSVEELGDSMATIAEKFTSAFANIGQGLSGVAASYYSQEADRLAQIQALQDQKKDVRKDPDVIGRIHKTKDIDRQIRALREESGPVGDAIGESIGQGVASAFRQAMTDMIIDEAILKPILAPFQKQMETATQEALKDGIVTADEQANLANLAAQASAAGQAAAKGLTPVLDGINDAATNIENGTASAAENFKDIEFPEKTKELLTDVGGLIDTTAKALSSVTLSGEAANAKDIAAAMEKAAASLRSSTLPPSLKLDVDGLETALKTAAEKLTEASLPDAVKDADAIVKAVSDAVQQLGNAKLTIDVALANVPQVPKFASGGKVPGVGTGDTVPAMLTPGERVLNLEETATYEKLLSLATGMKVQHFANGGVVLGNVEQQARQQLRGSFGGGRVPRTDLGKAIFEILQEQLSGFLGGGSSSQPVNLVKQVRDEYDGLTQALEKNRKSLTKAKVDVDDYLNKLAVALPEKLEAAFQEMNQGLLGALSSVKDDLTGLLTGPSSLLSPFEQIANLQSKEASLRTQLGTASDADIQGIAQELSSTIREQLNIAPFDKGSLDYRDFFNDAIERLASVEDTLQGRVNVERAKAGLAPTGGGAKTFNNTFSFPIGTLTIPASASDPRAYARELFQELEEQIAQSMQSGRLRTEVQDIAG